MSGQLRTLGILLSVCGNAFFAFGLGSLISGVNTLSELDSTFGWATLLPFARPLAMMGAGYAVLRFAPRFGGGSLGVQFFLIGVTSTWAAFHGPDGVERFVNFVIGGSFLFVSALGLVGIAMVYGWKHSLTHPSPVILRAAGVVQPFDASNLAAALRDATRLRGSGGIEPAGVASARQVAVPHPDELTAKQRAAVLEQLSALERSGALSREQVAAVTAWWQQPSG